jgi:hypothetical protein
VTLRLRICYVLYSLGIHSPDCKHCMTHLPFGIELRKRLEGLNEQAQPVEFVSLRHGVEKARLEKRKAG